MYDQFSADYDYFVNWDNRLAAELPFLEQLLRPLSGPGGQPAAVLDAACGTGRHAIALAQRGFTAAGADLSAPMIERARVNAQNAGVPVQFEAAGFGALAGAFREHPRFPFDAILCLGNSLPHLLTPKEVSEALDDFAACLRPGGLLVIQNRNFDAVLLHNERWMEPQSYRSDPREWVFLRFYDFNPDGSITFNIVTLFREGSSAWQQRNHATPLFPQREAGLRAALEAAGFSQLRAYGGLSGAPFDAASSGNLVLVAQRD